MRIATIVGARPQFIKAAVVGSALRSAGHEEILVHTGQHYDHAMSGVFFEELGIPTPDIDLGVGSSSQGRQTGEMLIRIEAYLEAVRPDAVVVYGDTNSTLAGALAAAKMGITLAHVEAGLRSFNRDMPEEHNRVVTDHLSDLLFCPTASAVENLRAEGVKEGVHRVGDPMFDAVLLFQERARESSTVVRDLGLEPGSYAVATVHRPYNTDKPDHLRALLEGMVSLDFPVVLPVHPRTEDRIRAMGLHWLERLAEGDVRLIDPVGYLDMLELQRNARVVLTDSGGMQKEAYFLGTPCVTLRPETEWVETLEGGWNRLLGADRSGLPALMRSASVPDGPRDALGEGDAAQRIAAIMGQHVTRPTI